MHPTIPVLDHGSVRLVETWGHGDAGQSWPDRDGHRDPDDDECGIIEAARQSTQAAFRGWEDKKCPQCRGEREVLVDMGVPPVPCPSCDGKGYLPGDARLLKYLFTGKPQHATPFEFAGMVIEVQAPIFVFREWHRHRTQSYNEMSARYSPLPDLNYVPTKERLFLTSTKNKQAGVLKGADELTEEDGQDFIDELREEYLRQELFYQKWLKKGVPKELARIDLPVGRYSRMRAATNLRNWLAFMTLRADPAAQYEIRMYAEIVGRIVEATFPRTYALYRAGQGAS